MRKIIKPETGATIMAYDSAGNLAWSRPGSTATSTNHCNVNNGATPNAPGSPPAGRKGTWGRVVKRAQPLAHGTNGNVKEIEDGATSMNQRGKREMEFDGPNHLRHVASPMFDTATYTCDQEAWKFA